MKSLFAILLAAGCSVACGSSEYPSVSTELVGQTSAALTGDGGTGDSSGASLFSSSVPLGTGYSVSTNNLPSHVAYLTFDDGPCDWTNDFLDILKAKGVHATFLINARNTKGGPGLNGSYVDEYGVSHYYRDLVKRELDEGHAIGNHTTDHTDLASLSMSGLTSELAGNEQLINQGLLAAGGTTHIVSLVRPPYGAPWFGSHNIDSSDFAAAEAYIGPVVAGYGVNVLWSFDSSDSWEWAIGESYSRTLTPNSVSTTVTYASKVARIQNTILNSGTVANGNGLIILMHDIHPTTRDALGAVIDGLVAQGYSFQTIEQYVQARWGRPSIELTAGPNLYTSNNSADEPNWGCQTLGAYQVCGRMWQAYSAAGGAYTLGNPIGNRVDGPYESQSFTKGTLVLHPENGPLTNYAITHP